VLACSLGSKYRTLKEEGVPSQRLSSTIKTNCPFRINGRKQADNKWKINLTNLEHNHERPLSLVGISNARRDSNTQSKEILRLSEANVRPRQIVRLLNESNLLTRKDIYNIISTEKRKKLGNRSVLEYLMEHLAETNCFHRHFESDSGTLTSLFFAFEEAIALGKRFKTTFVVDATYKTNRFKLPLLHFIGIDCFGRSFSACFMLMSKEEESEYLRALECFRECFGIDPEVFVTDKEDALRNSISVRFPNATNLLCIWHINKNILKNCLRQVDSRESFDLFMNHWNQVLYSSTEDMFNDNLANLRATYINLGGVIEYLDNNVIPLKRYIATPWTNLVKHLGNTATSRAEGQHRVVKEYFNSSMGDLLTVAKNLRLSCLNHHREFVAKVNFEKLRDYHRFDGFFDNVRRRVSSFALDLIQSQIKKARPMLRCSGSFTRVYGIACAHVLEEKINLGILLEIGDFSQQWWLDVEYPEANISLESEITRIRNLAAAGENATNSILSDLRAVGNVRNIANPTVPRTRGRPRGAFNRTTAREPSGFEHVEGVEGRKRCRNCNGLGHNARTCNRQ